MKPIRTRALVLACVALLTAVPSQTVAQPQPQPSPISIEKLVTDGWEVTGYVAASDIRSLILFKHKDLKHLVQCSVLIDVMRNPRLVTYCYELK